MVDGGAAERVPTQGDIVADEANVAMVDGEHAEEVRQRRDEWVENALKSDLKLEEIMKPTVAKYAM